MLFEDQLNRIIDISKTPKRIVSLVPSQTELLVDLGMENFIVGVTKFCIHPVNLKKTKTIVGGTKKINTEKIKALNPDLILCNKEENTKNIVEACECIAPTHVSDIYTIEDAKELIKQYGKILSCNTKALKINKELDVKLNDFHQFIANKKSKKTAYFIWRNPWMVAANNTFINYLLQLNKFKNIYANKERYPEVDIKVMEPEEKLELILLSSEPYPFKEIHIKEIQEYNPDSKILLVDGELFSWYGSRLLKAFDYFKELRNRI